MSNFIITDAGNAQIAAKQAAGQPLLIREMAVSTDLVNGPQPSWVALPSEVATRWPITTVGKIPDENAVLYATVLDTEVGDFEFALVGYYDEDGVLIFVDQIPPFDKLSGVSGNIFRHTCIVNFDTQLDTMPSGLPDAQWHPETSTMALLRADMGIAMDVATTAADTMAIEVPDIKDRLTNIETTYSALTDSDTQLISDVSDANTRMDGIDTEISDIKDDLEDQIKSVVLHNADMTVLHQAKDKDLAFVGELVTWDAGISAVSFNLPDSLKGVNYRLSVADTPIRAEYIRFLTDDFILFKREPSSVTVNGTLENEEQITVSLNPDRLKAFGTVQVTGVNSVTTMDAEGLDQVLNLVAGNGMELQADDSSNTVTISSNNSEGFQSLVVTEANYTSTLTSLNSPQVRLEPDGNIELSTISTTNTIKIKSIGFGEVLIRATDPNDDAILSGSDQSTLAFTETDTVKIRLEGYGTSNQALRFDTSFPDEINKSFTIEGGNLHIAKDAQQLGGFLYCEQIHCAGEIVGFSTTSPSDVSLKKHISILQNSLGVISELQGYRFTWSEEVPNLAGTTDVGLIAQEVQRVLPEAISPIVPQGMEREVLGIDHKKLIPVLVQALNELAEKVQGLEKKIEVLEGKET